VDGTPGGAWLSRAKPYGSEFRRNRLL
jgi:hypothetical protein